MPASVATRSSSVWTVLTRPPNLLLELRVDRDPLLQRGEVGAELLDDLAATECLLPADQLLDLREIAFPRCELAGGGTDRAGEEVDALDEISDLLVDPLLELPGIDGRRRGLARCILRHDAQLVLHGREPGLDALVALRERLGENREPALLCRKAARRRPDDAAERLDPLGQRRDCLVQRIGRSCCNCARRAAVLGHERAHRVELPSQCRELGRRALRVLGDPVLDASIEGRNLTAAGREAAGRLAHDRRQRVDAIGERLDRAAGVVLLRACVSAHQRHRVREHVIDVEGHRAPRPPLAS